MTTSVSFEIAKLLKEREFNEPSSVIVTNKNKHHLVSGTEHTLLNGMVFTTAKNKGLPDHICSAPTIAEAVMWFYEKHSLWILALPTITGCFAYKIVDVQLNPEKPIERPPYNDISANDYNLPTEAYEAAIKYCLEKII